VPAWQKGIAQNTGCDVFTVPFEPRADGVCLRYLTDSQNWVNIIPIPQKFESRTIKYKITYKEKGLHAMVKVPQRVFPHEPYHEVAAYHSDRLFGINRVPPTALVKISVTSLRNAASKALPTDYHEKVYKSFSEFVEKDVFGILKKDATEVPCSIVLLIANVEALLDSIYRVPYSHRKPGWHRWFNPEQFLFRVSKAKYREPLIRLSELSVFDYILGNTDRSPNKNNFVVAGPERPLGMPPTFVTLDNGMIFTGDINNPLRKANTTMCFFRRPLIARLQQLKNSFAARLMQLLPQVVVDDITPHSLKSAESRLQRVLMIVEKCLQKWNESTVLTE